MADSREIQFQQDIINAMLLQGWLTGPASGYDRSNALYTEDLLGYFKEAWPERWEKFSKNNPVEPRTEDPLLEQRDLDVLYVGATRAALGLHMLVNAGNRWEEPLSRAAADNSVSPGG